MTERYADSETLEAQYRGGCGADSIVSEVPPPDSIPEEAYVVDGGERPFPDDPTSAVPSPDPIRDVGTPEIIDYLSDVIPKYADRLETEYLDELQAVTGESTAMLRQDFEMIRSLSQESVLRDWLVAGDTDLRRYLDGWQDPGPYSETAVPIGSGVNVNAGHNVGAVAVPELWRALTKNAVLHKMPSNDQLTLRVLAEVYEDNPHPVAETSSVAYWPGGATELERTLFATDFVLAWGDDATIDAIQQRVAPTTRFIPFHFEFGAYLVDAATQRGYSETLLRQIATDFAWGDQLLCFSPLLMIVERCEETGTFLSDLAASLEEYSQTEYPMGAVPDEQVMKRTRTKRMARDRGELVSDWDNETTVVVREGLDRSDMEEFHTFRFVEAHTVDDLETAASLVGQSRNLQEFILATTTERGDSLRDALASTSATRIASPGGTQPELAIPWDGRHPTEQLVTWVSDER